MATAARDALLQALRGVVTARPRAVEVPELGVLYVRAPSLAEFEALRAAPKLEGLTEEQTLARGICQCLCDESGTRLLDPSNAEHVHLVSQVPWALLKDVVVASNEIFGVTKESAEGN